MTKSLKESGSHKNYSTDKPCTVCGAITENGNTFHHVKTRGAGGPDEPWNMMPLCGKHHTEIHMMPLSEYSAKCHEVMDWLIDNNWELIRPSKTTLKWVHPDA